MNLGFLFWLFLVGIIVAALQDLKRREVDNWLNLFLVFSSLVFIFYEAIFLKDISLIFQAAYALIFLFAFMNAFYYGRVFAGGDAKLLFAMTVFFIGATFISTLVNIGIFLLFLMLSGSVYGLTFSVVLYLWNFKKVNQEIKKRFNWLIFSPVVLGVIVILAGFVNFYFFIFGVLFILFPLLYVFAKGLERVSMVKEISGKDLREGDWLDEDACVGKKLIKASWDGLTKGDLRLLCKKKKIKIKQGIPFVPAFLIAFIIYNIFRDYFIDFLVGLG